MPLDESIATNLEAANNKTITNDQRPSALKFREMMEDRRKKALSSKGDVELPTVGADSKKVEYDAKELPSVKAAGNKSPNAAVQAVTITAPEIYTLADGTTYYRTAPGGNIGGIQTDVYAVSKGKNKITFLQAISPISQNGDIDNQKFAAVDVEFNNNQVTSVSGEILAPIPGTTPEKKNPSLYFAANMSNDGNWKLGLQYYPSSTTTIQDSYVKYGKDQSGNKIATAIETYPMGALGSESFYTWPAGISPKGEIAYTQGTSERGYKPYYTVGATSLPLPLPQDAKGGEAHSMSADGSDISGIIKGDGSKPDSIAVWQPGFAGGKSLREIKVPSNEVILGGQPLGAGQRITAVSTYVTAPVQLEGANVNDPSQRAMLAVTSGTLVNTDSKGEYGEFRSAVTLFRSLNDTGIRLPAAKRTVETKNATTEGFYLPSDGQVTSSLFAVGNSQLIGSSSTLSSTGAYIYSAKIGQSLDLNEVLRENIDAKELRRKGLFDFVIGAQDSSDGKSIVISGYSKEGGAASISYDLPKAALEKYYASKLAGK